MTITLKHDTINGYYIAIEQDKYSSAFRVVAYESRGGQWYIENTHTYGTMKQAIARYRVLRRKAETNTL